MGKRGSLKRNFLNYVNWMKKNAAYQNIWDATKAVPTGKFIALKCLIRKEKYLKVPTLKN